MFVCCAQRTLDLLERVKQLESWSADFVVPCPLWLSGLFNPMSFLTAVMQVRARAESLPLDDMCLKWKVSNLLFGAAAAAAAAGGSQGAQTATEISPPESGVYVHGFFLEGASWELGSGDAEGHLVDALPKVLQCPMPVIQVQAIPVAAQCLDGTYSCPVYLTSARGPTYICSANLRWGCSGCSLSNPNSRRRFCGQKPLVRFVSVAFTQSWGGRIG